LPLVFEEYDPSLVFVVETWLKPHIPDAFLCVQNAFSISRRDRRNAMGGGVCIFINNLNFSVVTIDDKYDDVELNAIDVVLSDKTIRFIVCYRPPYYDEKAKNYAAKLIECLNNLIKCAWPSVIVGDFNLPLINWSDNSSPLSCIYFEFFDFVSTRNGVISQAYPSCPRRRRRAAAAAVFVTPPPPIAKRRRDAAAAADVVPA